MSILVMTLLATNVVSLWIATRRGHDLDDCILNAVAEFNNAGADATPIGDAIARKMGVQL